MTIKTVEEQLIALQKELVDIRAALQKHFESDDIVQTRISEDIHKVLMLLLNDRVDAANQSLHDSCIMMGMTEPDDK